MVGIIQRTGMPPAPAGPIRASRAPDRLGTRPSDPALPDIAEGLKAAKDGFQSHGKELAAKRVELIKERMRALALMARADPEGAAKEAAKLAKELKEAVRAYVEAGGSPGIAAGSGPGVSPARPSGTAPTEGDAQTPDNASETVGPAPDIGSAARAGTTGDTDATFIDIARDLLKGLKKILETARNQSQLLGNRVAEAAVDTADETIGDAQRALDEIAGAIRAPVQIDVLA